MEISPREEQHTPAKENGHPGQRAPGTTEGTPAKEDAPAKKAKQPDKATMPLEDLLDQLQFSPDGLDASQVRERLEKYGYNEIPEKRHSPVLEFLSYFWGPIPVMIEIAAALSGYLQHWPDVGVILALLIMNGLVGFSEEHQASNAVAALKRQLAVKASVKREGHWTEIAARELVPGDLVRLHIGAIVPADARLLDGDPISVDQSALTGESLPVDREKGEVAYSGSIVRQGQIDAVVYATGLSAFYGRTVQLVEEAGKERSHFQQAVIRIANYLIAVALLLAAVILAVSILRGNKALEVVQFVLVLTIAAVPVAMPAVLSVTMALGARVLAVKKAIVTKLASVEEMAGIDVLCCDKTGTLTQNRLTTGDPFVYKDRADAQAVILYAALASEEDNQDSIDQAVFKAVTDRERLKEYKLVHFTPFDPVHKLSEAEVEGPDGQRFKAVKGAPQVIIALDKEAASDSGAIDDAIAGFAERGFRALGVARTEDGGDYSFQGVIPLYDPLREDSFDTVHEAIGMGLAVKMVTGDQLAIAREIAKQLELGETILKSESLEELSDQPEELAKRVEDADGFAQVFPEHKYMIVQSLQRHNHIVGMTGDGVNDAPALKQANAGIAVEGATDAARAAAAIVLLLPGLSVIVEAIRESRKTFQRMVNYAIYRIAETLALLIFLTIAIVVNDIYPVTAIMIVLLAILNDGAILSIAYDKVRYSNRPEAWDMRLVVGLAAFLGLFAVGRSLGIFYIGDRLLGLSSDVVQTLVYLNLSIGGHLTLFAARTRGPFWSVRPANILLGAVLGTQVVATFIAVYGGLMSPIGWKYAGIVWGYCLVLFLVQDQFKRLGSYILGAAGPEKATERSEMEKA